MNPYEDLVEAIIKQAINDYKANYKALKKQRSIDTKYFDEKMLKKHNKKLKKLEMELKEIVEFFNSSWFSILTPLAPNKILDKLEKEVSIV